MKIQVIQKAVIKKGSKYLIILRSNLSKLFVGYWDFPGGKLEQGEDPKETVEREVFEETNLNINVGKILGTYQTSPINRVAHQFVMYSVNNITGEIHLSPEHTKYMWATKKEILSTRLNPYMKLFFKDY